MHSVHEIARWFTAKNSGSIPSIKLQKLCYYAQAWSYALHNEPIIIGNFEAWVHGPVNRELWTRFRDIAYRDITIDDFSENDIGVFTCCENNLLDLVWNTYGEYSGYQLESLSHTERPWLEQRKGLSTYEASNRVIDPNTMKSYYRNLYSQDGVN